MRVECGGTRAAQGIQRFRSGRLLAKSEGWFKNASTPGGVRRIVNRLREDRRTPLHFWRSRMCRELLRILAAPARILSEPWRVLIDFLQQNAVAFANFTPRTFFKNHQKMVPKTPESIKMSQNGARSKKITPRSEKEAKNGQGGTAF